MITTENMPLVRKLVWDIVPCDKVRDFMLPLGLIPGSDDVTEMEHRASHTRLDRLAPLVHYLTCQSANAAQVVTAVMLRQDVNEEKADVVEHVVQQNASAIYGALCAILAQLIDDGVLVYGGF